MIILCYFCRKIIFTKKQFTERIITVLLLILLTCLAWKHLYIPFFSAYALAIIWIGTFDVELSFVGVQVAQYAFAY